MENKKGNKGAGAAESGHADEVNAQARGLRFPDLTREQMTEAQKRAYDAILAGPRGVVRGPFGPLLRSPELADRWQKLGEYLRFQSSLPARLNEFAIIVTARFWDAKYEWYAHKPLAIKGGLAESIAEDLVRNRRPANMKPDEELVYDFSTALHREHFIDDELFQRALALLGERGVIDLIGVTGFYTAVSMVLNVAEIPLPPGVPSPW
jgi:4-carboxymuconolactone decarboxylase